jgi:medium-chain acyl-[acyl-carrier-protein] hydrolase
MMPNQTSSSWFNCSQPNASASLRLFCFPYAGGSSYSFHSWTKKLPKTIEICPVELPGRGIQMNSHLLNHIEPLVQAIEREILPYLNKPFAFFGHSMGGLVSFELIHLLDRKYNLQPIHLFVSGCRAPQIKNIKPPIHNLPEPDFLNEIRRFNGTPEAVLKNPELMEMLIPILRSDFTVWETYVYTQKSPLNCPINVFGGLQDPEVSLEELEAWREQTNASFSLNMFSGDHFFIYSSESFLLEHIAQKLHSF